MFREKIAETDSKLSQLQDAEDNYYITAKYVLDLASRAHDLFISSEVEERRQLINLVLSNPRVEGNKVRYEAVKPFDTILEFADSKQWLPLVDMFVNQEIQWDFNLQNVQTVYQSVNK